MSEGISSRFPDLADVLIASQSVATFLLKALIPSSKRVPGTEVASLWTYSSANLDLVGSQCPTAIFDLSQDNRCGAASPTTSWMWLLPVVGHISDWPFAQVTPTGRLDGISQLKIVPIQYRDPMNYIMD